MPDLSTRLQALRMKGHPLEDALALTQEGVDVGHLPEDELDELIEYLEQGQDWLSDEVGFEFLGDELRVSFRDETEMCDPQAFLEALRALSAGA